MSIMGFIKNAKDKFTDYKVKRIQNKTRSMEEERVRQSKLASANKEYINQNKELDRYKKVNAKGEAMRPSILKRLGDNLAKAQAGKKNKDKKYKGASKNRLKAENRGINLGGMETNAQYRPMNDSPFKSGGSMNNNPFSMGRSESKGQKKKSPFEF